ncbi:hypothetical protein AKJ09_06026 [Labilithrix luteola]|uniref:Uncharacterized protein n=1 Tax=Labilithrix luteola TaxID=1391654 RepID=A0A0K1Q0V1_9BACT|nr:hypothetical protein AKJ09_06026 [Labilithrix luteola]
MLYRCSCSMLYHREHAPLRLRMCLGCPLVDRSMLLVGRFARLVASRNVDDDRRVERWEALR